MGEREAPALSPVLSGSCLLCPPSIAFLPCLCPWALAIRGRVSEQLPLCPTAWPTPQPGLATLMASFPWPQTHY